MTPRLTLLLLATLACATACNKPAAPAADVAPSAPAAAAPTDASAPAATPAAAPEAPAPDPAAVAAAEAAANAAMAAAANGPALVPGTDYVEIKGGQPFDPLNGKVEVTEVFGYVCPACAMFQPLVSAWKAKLPSDVRFTYVPAQFGGIWDRYARAYYTAESMGIVDKTHDALYQAIHVQQTLKGERGQDSDADIAAFYGRYGVNPQQFASTMASFSVDAKLKKAKAFALQSGIEGTPTLIVNGKYRVKGGSYEDALRIANQLVAQERAAAGGGGGGGGGGAAAAPAGAMAPAPLADAAAATSSAQAPTAPVAGH